MRTVLYLNRSSKDELVRELIQTVPTGDGRWQLPIRNTKNEMIPFIFERSYRTTSLIGDYVRDIPIPNSALEKIVITDIVLQSAVTNLRECTNSSHSGKNGQYITVWLITSGIKAGNPVWQIEVRSTNLRDANATFIDLRRGSPKLINKMALDWHPAPWDLVDL